MWSTILNPLPSYIIGVFCFIYTYAWILCYICGSEPKHEECRWCVTKWTFMSCLYVLVSSTTSEDGYSHLQNNNEMLIVKPTCFVSWSIGKVILLSLTLFWNEIKFAIRGAVMLHLQYNSFSNRKQRVQQTSTIRYGPFQTVDSLRHWLIPNVYFYFYWKALCYALFTEEGIHWKVYIVWWREGKRA